MSTIYPRKNSFTQILFGASCLLTTSHVLAIVPVDHATAFPDGWSGELGLSINGQSGNKDETEFSFNHILRHKQESDLLLFISDYNYSETNDVIDEDELFVHLRWISLDYFQSGVDYEMFIQHQYDDFADISGRSLLGAGARWRSESPMDNGTLQKTLGTGLFYEDEKSELTDLEDETVRANLYAKLIYNNTSEYPYTLFGNVYIQPDVTDIEDLRVVATGGIEFAISKAFRLVVEAEIKHNSMPFIDIEKTDFEYGVRLSYQF